jgi:hypothetical protein
MGQDERARYDRDLDEALHGSPRAELPDPRDYGAAECPACGLPMFDHINRYDQRVTSCIDVDCVFG